MRCHEELLRRHGPHFDGWDLKHIASQASRVHARIRRDGFCPLYAYESGLGGGDKLIHVVIRVSRIDVFPNGWPDFLEIAHDASGNWGTCVYERPARARLLYEGIARLSRPRTLAELGVSPSALRLGFGFCEEAPETVPQEWYQPHPGALP
jgi:hypothetical protein